MKTADDVISAIRALGQIFPQDVAEITAALSSKISHDLNAHLELHAAAVDSLDDLSSYITDSMEMAA